MIRKQIGWQKYEDVLKERISSPILKEIIEEAKQNSDLISNEEYSEEDTVYDDNYEQKFLIAIPNSVMDEASLATSFDCWIGHTNFNITAEIKDKVNKIDGVEILKIHSRYRFFIGIGKMFDFSSVRQDIEKAIL